MKPPKLEFADREGLLVIIRKRRRELRELVNLYGSQDKESHQQLVDELLELSMDDIPIDQWPPALADRFIKTISDLTLLAVSSMSNGGKYDEVRLEALQAIADMLCCLAATTDHQADNQAKLQACSLWVLSRLAEGVTFDESQGFLTSSVAALSPLGIPHIELVGKVQAEIFKHLSQQLAVSQPQTAPANNEEILDIPAAIEPLPPDQMSSALDEGETADPLEITPVVDITIPEGDGSEVQNHDVTSPAPTPSSAEAFNTADVPTESHMPQAQEKEIANDLKPIPPESEKGVIKLWYHYFRVEKDVNNRFGEFVEKVLNLSEVIEPLVRQPMGLLRASKRQYDQWVEQGHSRGTTSFLSSATHAALTISEKFLEVEHPHAAFRIINVFGEIAKMLIPRNREKNESLFERFALYGCYAISDSWRISKKWPKDAGGSEIEDLSVLLQQVIVNQALGTYFRTNTSSFERGRVDTVIGERVVNEALARHFDKQLRHLLESDRPLVREYVRTNMPVVYRLKLAKHWDTKHEEWERLLEDAGSGDVVRLLRDMGDLIDPDRVGQLTPERQEEIARSATLNDYNRVSELLADSAKELRAYLYKEAQRLLDYRAPARPALNNREAVEKFSNALKLLKPNDRRAAERALVEVQNAWQIEINNLELLDWVAYLEAKTGNLQPAEQKFEQLQRKRAPKRSFVTEWNLAVLKFERKYEPEAYQLLLPLLDAGSTDENLTLVVLALSLKLDDRTRFLETVPRTMSLRYHPLALTIAHEIKDIARVEDLLAQLLAQWRGKWELPPVEQRYGSLEELKQKVVNKAIVEGQTEQLIRWLEVRIKAVAGWVPNYLALAEVLENWGQDAEGAFRVLENRLAAVRKRTARSNDDEERLRYQRSIDQACEDLLNLARRTKRKDLGQRAYEIAEKAGARKEMLNSYSSFAPDEPQLAEELQPSPEIHETATPSIPRFTTFRDPQLADRVMWVNAGLAKIRNVNSYHEKSKEIEEFINIVAEVGPNETEEVLKIIRSITSVIETFSHTDAENPEDRSTRRTLYGRVTGYEKELAQLLQNQALSSQLIDLITPYRQALHQVVGDLSRLAGVGPVVDVVVENPFISLESSHSMLVLRVINKSERAVTDVTVETISENPAVLIAGNRKKNIKRLESQRSELLSIAVERGNVDTRNMKDITFAISLRASAQGFPDVEIGIKKLNVSVNTFQEVVGSDQIPKMFQEGPLRPSAPELFQGRNALLNNIRNSFYGGTQRERYFFDGIRRVGKTSILNFLPLYLPENVLPVIANFDILGLRGRFNSAAVLHRFCALIADAATATFNTQLDLPDQSVFDADPGQGFDSFLAQFTSAMPGRVPMLMVDEFQDLLSDIAATGTERNRDTLVLDQIRGHLDAGSLYAMFTGSVRFDRVSRIVDHRIFGSLKRLPVSFLSEDSVGEVIRKGLSQWAVIPQETIRRVHELTGGYPWLVQKYGLELVNLLNEEHRTVATPNDVEDITTEKILWDNMNFEHWWPTDQLGANEERFIEWLLRKYPTNQPVSIRSFFTDVGGREQQTFRLAFENLRACEVLDSTQTEYLQFSGSVLRRWLEQQMQDGQLHIRVASQEPPIVRGQAGIFIDHENLVKSLEEISVRRGVAVPGVGSPARVKWFSDILKNLLAEAEKRVGTVTHKVAVAFWNRPDEAQLSLPYHANDFQVKQPEDIRKGNEVDFKLADEARRARERAHKESTTLSRAIIVTGDGDLSHVSRGLMNDGVSVQIWGGSRNTGDKYITIVGSGNFIVLEDVCGL
jgi:hypothetical protein